MIEEIEALLNSGDPNIGFVIDAQLNAYIPEKPDNGTDFSLKELREFVGGHIEIVWFENFIMVINEEGKLNNLPINFIATELYQEYYGEDDYIVGNCLICRNALVK